jgi:UDP-N-acetylmuramyl tripeptide synthase
VTCVEPGERSTALALTTPVGDLRVELPLEGLYNAYNAIAAVAGALALGLPLDATERALASFRAAFGRQEWFEVDGRRVEVLLGKNPTGMNQVLRTIASRTGPKRLLLFLNDGIADGRDISWIWDTDYELLAGDVATVVVAGTRAEELALRLKYSGFAIDADTPVVDDTRAALERALAATPAGETLFVVPTYTAMLKVRELLAKRGGRAHFWEDA